MLYLEPDGIETTRKDIISDRKKRIIKNRVV